jgi:hypothetical protein
MTMKTHRVLFACLALVVVGLTARPALASWESDNCFGSSKDMSAWKRSQAYAYAQPAVDEGYALSGGCYKLNDRDDTPTLPADGGGEGADCSGFVFKTWALKSDGSPGFRYWDHEKDIHGPYSTWQYVAPDSDDPFKLISKTYSSTQWMDAFVWRFSDYGHIGMIQAEGTGGFDYIVHARNNTVGTVIDWIDYRSTSYTKGLTRKGWTPECTSKCPTV